MMSNSIHIILILALLFTFQAAINMALAADPNDTVPDAESESNDPGYDLIDNINPEDARVTLNFQNVLVSEVLDYLSETAGMVIIAESYPEGRINLISKQPLIIDEVIAMINTVLKEKGYAAIRTERNLKIVRLSEAVYLNIPVTSGNDPEKIIAGDEIVTHIIPIRHANAVRIKEDLEPLISENTIISSNEASNSLIITDTTANIKRLAEIVKSVDTQMASVADVKVFILEYADAENTANLINNVFEQRTTQSSQGNMPQMPFFMQRGGRGRDRRDDNQSSATGSANVPVVADADERTNTVVVSGPADVLPIIEQVVKELDSNPNEERSLFIYKLKYAQAENVRDRLNSLFQELENINEQNTRGRGGDGGRGSATESSGDISDEVYIEADADTNTLVIMTSSKNYEKIKGVIEDLDIPIPQVLIKVLLAELTTTDALDIGVEWDIETTNSRDYTFLNNFTYSPLPTEGWTSQIIAGELDITLRALQEIGTLNVLSRPYIMTSNNQTALINVGQRYPFITDSQITDTGNTINTVDYENIGITLEVTPTINADGLVIMDVNPEITIASSDTVRVSETVDATIFATRSAECRVAVPNGQTVVIGGLMQDSEGESVEQIPLLGDLPLIGFLFKHIKTDDSKTELLIFLTPQVAEEIEDFKVISDHERNLSPFLNKDQDTILQKHVENMESVFDSEISDHSTSILIE